MKYPIRFATKEDISCMAVLHQKGVGQALIEEAIRVAKEKNIISST